MGASSSFSINTKIDIYLSYPEKNVFIERMIGILQKENVSIIESSLVIKNKSEFSNNEISNYMEMFIDKTKYIFVCISKKTTRSVTQIIEMNEIIDKFPIVEKKLIYLMMDLDYTPETNKELKSITKKNDWYPLYDNSLFETTNKLLKVLLI
jgi:hypothetical protein